MAFDLLAGTLPSSMSLEEVIARLAGKFGVSAAGLAGPMSGDEVRTCRVQDNGRAMPAVSWRWEEQADLLTRLRSTSTGLSWTAPSGDSWLLISLSGPDGSRWLLWLEGLGTRAWTAEESSTLMVAGLGLMRAALQETDRPRWVRQMARACARHRLEAAALVVRRLAHDFGNVLTPILGFNELALQHAPTGSALFRYLSETHKAAEQGAELTYLLQMFGCRKVGQIHGSPLQAIVAQEAARLRTCGKAGIDVQWEAPSDLPPVAVNEPQLRTILVQLLDNARDALAGAGVIRMTASSIYLNESDCEDIIGNVSPGPFVELVIADTGCGIAPEVRAHLLAQPFYSTKPRHRGLGLAVVYGILFAHGGGFRLEAAPASLGLDRDGVEESAGTGTQVSVYLPFAAPPATLQQGIAGAMGNERILVVDDDPSVLRYAGATLEGAGYRVQLLDCPVKALDCYIAAAQEPFDLVLADVILPRMSGFDLARRLLHHDAKAQMMFTSGHPSAELAHDHGVDWSIDFLSKPFRPDELLRMVRTVLDRTSRTTSPGNGGVREESVVRSP